MYRQLIKFDKWCNYQLRKPMNWLLKKKDGYEFGDKRETISSALGKNMIDHTLTDFGYFICSLIEVVDTFIWLFKKGDRPYRDHCLGAVHDISSPLSRFHREISHEAKVEAVGEVAAIVKSDPPKDVNPEGDTGLPRPPRDTT